MKELKPVFDEARKCVESKENEQRWKELYEYWRCSKVIMQRSAKSVS